MICLDPEYRILVWCQNIPNVINEYKLLQPELENEMLTDEHCKGETESDIIEKLIIRLLNESNHQFVISTEINQMVKNQNKILKLTDTWQKLNIVEILVASEKRGHTLWPLHV